jgi:uncharacterized damage-inducible protein DinB
MHLTKNKFRKMRFLNITLFCLLLIGSAMSQEKLPYYEIPEAPEKMTAGGSISRILDGLGYRYYWATEGLREDDLAYRISEDSRTAGETIDHLFGLTEFILKVIKNEPNVRGGDKEELSFADKRKKTLENIHSASKLVRKKSDQEVDSCEIIIQRGENSTTFPIWNLLNGPIADAIYHTGQIVTYRRASGNPLYPGVSVFTGKTRM